MSKLEVDAIEPQSGTTLTLGASGDAVNIASGASITDFKSTGIDDNATSTAITIDSSERVGIGTTNPTYKLQVVGGNASTLLLDNGGEQYIQLMFQRNGTANSGGDIILDGTASTLSMRNLLVGDITFQTSPAGLGAGNPQERMRIESSGNVLIGKTSGAFGTAGSALFSSGSADFVNSDRLLVLNRLSTDGELMGFYQASSQEGSISVSGATVAYNGFTGTHWSRFTDNSKPTILKGTVLESLDEMCDWYNLEFDVTDVEGNTYTKKVPHILADGQSNGDVITYDWNTGKKDENDNDIIEQVQATIVKEADIKHVKSKVSDTVDAKNVYGVFVAYDEDGEGYNDFYVASVGSFVVRIKANETIAKGDLLQSNGDGTAKVQSDDAIRASTFAKVLSTTVIETYEDGSFLVPCSLMC